ncbi:uncharacterized protein TRIADDRAFT_22771 [Trichoplax adhaerens]|uniref:Methylmalonic aciduria and homocystinuria type D protein, mitochondrial n=1 Tax=Trichoplax adhaerens TaxID=10228 RepID=B3RQY7_TRIAD|nr:hypothetical protein TRIADDRAFT_22771 [Trichoplax adhaerens]EDV26249.1 hypothetical protein TRIADDRAFT_22771 [Trichoplax adhaerens]|eukprot:XP_002110245.1 hypothetical protein TRIADDRAFT_22771 [Trichoplax adhaerens]
MNNAPKDEAKPVKTVSVYTQTTKSPEEIKQAPVGSVECIVQQVPSYYHQSFMELFPSIRCEVGDLNVLTLCQRSKLDSSVYSEDMALEREQLLKNFISASMEIVSKLISAGYWANFIDPASGRAFLGTYCNNTFYETDERYRHLGFKIEDLGCCKAIIHRFWGTNVFVGSIFTDAPIDSPLLKNIFTEDVSKN